MAAVTVGGAIRASFGNVPTAWRRSGPALFALVVAAGATQLARLAPPPQSALLALLGGLIQQMLQIMAIGAIYRVALVPYHPRDPDYRVDSGGIQWSGIEWRVLASGPLVGLLVGFIGFLLAVVWGIALGATVGAAGGDLSALQEMRRGGLASLQAFVRLMSGPAGIISALVLFPSLVLLTWLGGRLSLLAIRAADTATLDMGAAWRLSRGVTWALVVGLVVTFIVTLAASSLTGGALGLAAAAVPAPAAAKAAVYASVGGMIAAAIRVPLVTGLLSYVYLGLKGDVAIADTFA